MSTEQASSEKKHPKNEHLSPAWLQFRASFEGQDNLEERLRMTINFMKESLSQKGTPRFKDFWEAKKMCLPLFKEKINPLVKGQMWTEYTELSSEAKRLKDLLEEQSSFAVEQMELALKALREDLELKESRLAKITPVEFSEHAFHLRKKAAAYDKLQREIQFYVTLASRMKDLREGIILTDMRVRHKNKLLKDLSAIGDLFIPAKKMLVKQISSDFLEDVQAFAEAFFDLEQKQMKQVTVPLFKIREEIKAFQEGAKKIALNPHAFGSARMTLSQCWEILKEAEKERKKEFLERKQASSEHLSKIEAAIQEFEEGFKNQPADSKHQIYKKVEELMELVDTSPLVMFEKKALKQKIKSLQDGLIEPFALQEREELDKQKEKETARFAEIAKFQEETLHLIHAFKQESLQTLESFYENFDSRKKSLKPAEKEKSKLCELKKELYEVLLLKREDEVGSDEEAVAELISEWEGIREEARTQMESYRKGLGLSGFDFEKAMMFGQLVDLEKTRLDRAVKKVAELEERLY